MKKRTALVVVALAAATAALAGAQLGGGSTQAAAAGSDCQLGNGKIKHLIYLQFDNTHYNRDNPSVPSELELMPHLLSFLTDNGTLFTNDHTILISHTAGGILSSLTGLYPDRNGQTVSNSYFFYSSGAPTFSSSFKYWTAPVDPALDPLPNMITDTGKNTPAPWVPFTRAGCDVGGVGTANIELENNSTAPTGDITKVFGNGSPEWNEASTSPQLALTDFVGIAIHCAATASSKCAGNEHAKADTLPEEPNGYDDTQFKALFGTKYVDPAITGGSPCVKDTSGAPVTDAIGNCGFPGFDGMLAKNTLGYVAAMQEAGVPVTYGYISDAHDFHTPNLAGDSYSSAATGPGEITHNQQLQQYDDAFAAFFKNLQEHGINKENTLFVVTVVEGDHFAGGVGAPAAGGDWLVYDHRTCTVLTSCPSNQIGEIGYNLKATLPGTYTVHNDDAPTFYVNGQPGPTDAAVRALERNAATITQFDPYSNSTVNIAQGLIDVVGERAIHMVNADTARTPTFTMFGNPDFFFQTSAPCTGVNVCVTPGFAWNHGDMQDEIGSTWVGFVGPGIQSGGIDNTTWTDHTNLRPTILSLLGLQDDYVEDGHVLTQALTKQALPGGLSGSSIPELENAYEQVNASFGDFSMAVIKASTKALAGTDAQYASIESSIDSLTTQRDTLATTIRNAFYQAANGGGSITQSQAQSWISQANSLISQAQALS